MKYLADSEEFAGKQIGFVVLQTSLRKTMRLVYYVLMTRGIKGTYLYVCDDDLRDYLSQYIEME